MPTVSSCVLLVYGDMQSDGRDEVSGGRARLGLDGGVHTHRGVFRASVSPCAAMSETGGSGARETTQRRSGGGR
jgi:hypothetical protein